MASEIRVNSLSSRTGLSTVTFTDTGPIFSGITTFQDNSGFNVGTGGSIFSPASNTVTLGTNNAERFRITSAGNIIPGTNNATSIGDGTTNFASIWASTRFRGNDNVKLILGNSQDLVIRHDGTNNIIGSPVGGDLHIKSGTGDNDNQLIAAFKHSNASVGIGTSNPTNTLEISKVDNHGITLRRPAGGSNPGTVKFEVHSNGAGRLISERDFNINFDTDNLGSQHFSVSSNGSEKVRITSGGNIGINETSPYYKLHLKTNNNATSLSGGGSGNWGGDGIRIENENTTGGSMSLAHFRTYDADWHIGNKYVGANNSDFIFSSEGNERLRITSDGKMGVGTASPNHRLTLHNSGTGTFDALNITSGLTNSVGLQFGIDSASNVFFWHTANGGIKFATNNVERARVTNNGITFNGDTAADNALNDYEQGTWNPTIAFGGSSTGVSYSERQGIYVKIGNLVWASIVISLTNNGSGTGDVSITLPFTVGSNSENRGIGTLAYFAGFAGLNSNPNIYASSGGATTCRLQHLNNGGGGNGTQVTTLTHGNISNTAGIRGAIMYTTI